MAHRLKLGKFDFDYMALKNIGIAGIVAIGAGAIALFTNPGEQEYQKYAALTLRTKIKDKICTKVSQDLGVWLEGQCHILVTTASPYLAEIVARQTERDNFFLFSIYQTNVPLPDPLSSYHLKTFGAFNNFYIYQAQKQ